MSPALLPRRLRHCATAAGVRRHRGPSPNGPSLHAEASAPGVSAGIQARLGSGREEQAGWEQHVWGPGRASASQRVCVCFRTVGDVAQAERRLANVLQTQTTE